MTDSAVKKESGVALGPNVNAPSNASSTGADNFKAEFMKRIKSKYDEELSAYNTAKEAERDAIQLREDLSR